MLTLCTLYTLYTVAQTIFYRMSISYLCWEITCWEITCWEITCWEITRYRILCQGREDTEVIALIICFW